MSLLFESYRAVGLITTGRMTPVRRLGDAKNFVTCPAGRAFYVYDCDKLRVSIVSKQIPSKDDINYVVAVGSEFTYVAAGKSIFCFKRAECIGEFKRKDGSSAHDAQIEVLCNFGNGDVLISIDQSGTLRTWSCHDFREQDLPECDLGSDFRTKCVLHPKTYLNKVLIGGESGLLQLWNFRSGKLVHSFKDFDGKVSVECAEQSPAVDVVAVGLGDGSIRMHNLRFDKSLFTLQHAAKAKVTSLAFFTDDRDEGIALLASGARNGEICIWDLKQRVVLHQLTGAHADSASVLSLQFLPGEYTLLSCGSDNALKSWQMDSSTFHLRPLKKREGHAKSALKVKFHPQGSTIATLSSGSDGRALQMICSGEDRSLRSFHGALDNHAKEFSQKSEEPNKLRRITCIATSEAREKDWFNVVTTHEGDYSARVWRFEHGTLGEGVLNMRSRGYSKLANNKRKYGGNDSDYISVAMTCCISNCGNFAYVGSASGIVSQYNLQSGRFISSFPKQLWDEVEDPETAQKIKAKRKKIAEPSSVFATTGEMRTTVYSRAKDAAQRHKGAVTGLCLDGFDESLFSVGYDSFLRVWDSQTQDLLEEISLGGSPATQLERSRDGGLFAVATDDLAVSLFDVVSRRVVRRFQHSHQAKITDMCFSPNTRWLVTSSMDTSLKVWDLSTSRCVDHLRFPSACTSVSFSPSNEYIATTHVGSAAICLWVNKVHFGSAKADKIAKRPVDIELPCFSREDDEEDEDDTVEHAEDSKEDSEEDQMQHVKPTKDIRGTIQLSEAMATSSRWFTLWHLELIKERNKPIQPADKPQQVPFFLPVFSGELDGSIRTGDADKEKSNEEAMGASRIISTTGSSSASWTMASALSQELEELVSKSRAQASIFSRGRKSKGKAKGDREEEEEDDDELDAEEQDQLRAVRQASAFAAFVSKLNTMSASAVDYELRSLSLGPEDEEGSRVLQVWLEWILIELRARTNFELVQSILGRLIKLYGDSFKNRDELKRLLDHVRDEQKKSWKALQSMMQKCLCYVESYSQLNSY